MTQSGDRVGGGPGGSDINYDHTTFPGRRPPPPLTVTVTGGPRRRRGYSGGRGLTPGADGGGPGRRGHESPIHGVTGVDAGPGREGNLNLTVPPGRQ